MPKRLLVAASDAGGARCVLPVVRELRSRGDRVIACVAGPARAFWSTELDAIDLVETEEGLDEAGAREILGSQSVSALVSACGAFNRMEHSFRQAARRAGLTSIGVMDSWLHYRERFERDGERCLPDFLCIDTTMDHDALEALGFTGDRLVVTGQPHLEQTVDFVRRFAIHEASALRGKLGLRPGARIWTFFSDPFFLGPGRRPDHTAIALVAPDGRSRTGYTPDGILREVLESARHAASARSIPVEVLVKAHPREHPEVLEEVLTPWSDPLVSARLVSVTPRELIGLSDAVFGMISITLLEAAVCGRPSISVQIGRDGSGGEDLSLASQLGACTTIPTRPALDALIGSLIATGEASPGNRETARLPLCEGATARIVDAIDFAMRGRLSCPRPPSGAGEDMAKLAIHGGNPVIDQPWAAVNTMGAGELEAVRRVIESGCLSGFVGAWGDAFDGGPEVKAFEAAWRKRFGARHALSVNSATSGLFAAMGAIKLGPGDEVIVPPYTMSATAMAPLVYGGIPVFVDIDPETFCLDLEQVEKNITSRTKAILAVNLFGHPARLHELRALADRRGLYLIEDNAQGPLAQEHGRHAGTIGHLGVFSLNYHKHLHTGEGGVVTTDDEDLALRIRLIRNHGENVVEPLKIEDMADLVGFNYRMTELSAAVGLAQLNRIDDLVGPREVFARRLSDGLRDLDGLTPPVVRDGCRHVYYVWAMRFDAKKLGVDRALFAKALKAEGVPFATGYVRPLYLLPIFQKRVAIGRQGFPFTQTDRTYPKGLCPTTEHLHEQGLMEFHICTHSVDERRIDQVIEAVRKVHGRVAELRA